MIINAFVSLCIGENDNGDLCQADMGLGLPYRPGSFDGVISISAIQWLCYSGMPLQCYFNVYCIFSQLYFTLIIDSNEQDPKLRLNRFFSSLYSVMKKNARAVLQFYPENADQVCQ